jgi:ribosomal protein S18 acetylase RimI-like enzyme
VVGTNEYRAEPGRRRNYDLVMAATGALSVRLLVIADVDHYLRDLVEVDAESGVDGAPHSHPYSRSEPFDAVAGHDREVTRWSTDLLDVGWRRAWGLLDGDRLIGSLYLAGGTLHSESHRVNMGMGVLSSHRRMGGGSLLLSSAIAWARNEPIIDWIDLGVFGDNPGAQALYVRHGFRILGRTPDRFRVDGQSIDDISMTLNVASKECPL